MSVRCQTAFAVGLLLLSMGCTPKPTGQELVRVRFAMLPYGDHTYAIIGAKQGWFKEVGIDFNYETTKIDNVIAELKNNRFDAVSVPPGMLFSSFDMAPNLRSFVFGDLFLGFAIMSRPDPNIKSYSEFRKEGLSAEDAIHATARQLRGKVFAYPTETSIKPFIDLVLQKGGIQPGQFKALVLDDPLTVNAMRNGQADFQVGGVPSRLTLQREGFKPILTAKDLAETAKPSPDSPELASILENGWATTKEYYDNHHDIILRLASVNYRIMQFINDHPDDAAAFQMPYLSQVTGEQFTTRDARIIYSSLDPFYTFKRQYPWFHDPGSIEYYANINGAILNSFISQHVYKGRVPTVEDVIFADDIYRELESLRTDAARLLETAQRNQTGQQSSDTQVYQRAKAYFDTYDYLDAKRVAQQLTAATQH